MQQLNLIYQNRYAIYLTSCGFCFLSREGASVPDAFLGADTCLIFYPPGFNPDEIFCTRAEAFCMRTRANILWIENPCDNYPLWRCHALAGRFPLALPVASTVLYLTALTYEEDSGLWFTGTLRAGADYFSIPDAIRLSLDSCEGTLSFSVSSCGKMNLFSALRARLRYILPAEKTAGDGQSPAEAEITGNYMTFFESGMLLSDESITLSASISPCRLLDENVTFLSLPQAAFTCGLFGSDAASFSLIPVNGRIVPEITASALFRQEETGIWAAGNQTWYWTLAGSFRLLSETPGRPMTVIPGMSGTEYLCTDGTVQFIPHQNALLSEKMEETELLCLTGHASSGPMTSWLSFCGDYYSASDSMPLFISEKETSPSGFLTAYIPRAASFDTQSPAFPLLPWKNAVCGTPGMTDEAERRLRHTRFNLLTNSLRMPAAGTEQPLRFCQAAFSGSNADETIAVSPCGLCIGVSEDKCSWNWIGIAQTSPDALPDIRFSPVSNSVRLSLQKKDAYLLFSAKEQFAGTDSTDPLISLPVCGWNITMSENTWMEGQTLMLLKYTDTCTIRELIQDTPQLSWLLSLACSGDGAVRPEYQPLFSVLDNPDYQGIVLLGAEADSVSTGAEIEAVLREIPPGGLRAVYTLIPKSRLDISPDGQIKVGLSDISSYFFYQGDSLTNEQLSGQTLDLRTTDLSVMIQHNTITGLCTHMELLITELFGSPLTPADELSDSCIILKGQMEHHSDASLLHFEPESAKTFLLPDSPLSQLVLRDIRMSSGDDCTQIQLAGELSFQCEDACDLFSYSQISFTGVRLIREPDRFYADYQDASLLAETASARSGSFAEAFGASISGILFCQNVLPDDIGFFSINTPVRQNALKPGWNGIIWNLSLGSSGELGNSGSLCLEFLAAWKQSDYYFGVRFPEISGSSFLLQGLITANFTGIELTAPKDKALCFKLHGMTLCMLGLSFPRQGTEVFLFAEHGKIAWYAGYENKEDTYAEI